jgi:hypothetical protein
VIEPVLAKRLQQRDSWPALHNAQSGRKHIANIFTKLGVHRHGRPSPPSTCCSDVLTLAAGLRRESTLGC